MNAEWSIAIASVGHGEAVIGMADGDQPPWRCTMTGQKWYGWVLRGFGGIV